MLLAPALVQILSHVNIIVGFQNEMYVHLLHSSLHLEH